MQLLNKCYEKVTKFVTKNKELIYIMPLIIFVLTSILSDKTNFANKLTMQMSVIRYICLFIILIKIIICDISKYNKKTIIKIFFLGIITTIVSIIIDSRILIQYLIIIIGAYNIKIENIFRNILIFETMLVFFIIILSALGVVPNYVVTRGNTSNVIRNSLGFEFGTYPAIFTFYLTLLYLYYRKDKIKVYEYIVLFFINFIIYRLTDTRTDFICSVMIILASLLYSRMKNENIINKIAIITSKYIMIFLTLLSLILTISYNENNPNMKKMNSVL
ncbi:MAG: hypothetical protein HFJ38_07435, partial [Bacilli bacterium]|nr:hypothetical protein [Bacilli bacterium]